MSIIICSSYIFEFQNLSPVSLSSLFLLICHVINRQNANFANNCAISGVGFLSNFYFLIFLPFLTLLPLRLISTHLASDWLKFVSFLFFGIGIRKSLSNQILESHFFGILGLLALCPWHLPATNILSTIPCLYLLMADLF